MPEYLCLNFFLRLIFRHHFIIHPLDSFAKVFITNMAVYQIPEEFRERFLKETKLLKTAENGPVQLFRVLPAESGTFL